MTKHLLIHLILLATGLALTGACARFAPPRLQSEVSGQRSTTFEAEGSGQAYTITAGGLLDEHNTRVYTNPYNFVSPKYRLNRSVSIRNTGPAAVLNPRVVIDGRGPAWTIREIVERHVRPGDSEADKARAIYEWMRSDLTHGTDGSRLSRNPVLLFNALGYALCDENGPALAQLWAECGLKSFHGAPRNHFTTVAVYDGGTHLLDGNFRTFFLDRDNKNILPEEALAQDPDLVFRGTGSWPVVLTPEERYYYALKYRSMQQSPGPRTKPMAITPTPPLKEVWLRQDESLVLTWDEVDEPFRWDKLKSSASHRFRHLYKGHSIYTPEISASLLGQHGVIANNLTHNPPQSGRQGFYPDNATVSASFSIQTAVPTLLLDAEIELEFAGLDDETNTPTVRIEIGNIGEAKVEWTTDAANPSLLRANLKRAIGASKSSAQPQSHLTVTVTWPEGQTRAAGLVHYHQDLTFQVNHSALPSLRLGTNDVTYLSDGPDEGRVTITHEWEETWETAPPAAPRPLSPIGEVKSLQPEFRWEFDSPETEAAATQIHIQVFDREDFRWPVANALEPLYPISRVPGSQTQWTPHRPGLMNPGQTYWWKVRFTTSDGVWSPWSPMQTFTPHGPMRPVDVTVSEIDGRWMLTWAPHPEGERPAAYEIHASNRYGFTAYDQPYLIHLPAKNKWDWFEDFDPIQPPTRIGQISGLTFDILEAIGAQCDPLAPAYFRVVAVDAAGARSDTSDFAALPTPRLLAPQTVDVTPGQSVTIPLAAAHSLGAYHCSQTRDAVYHHKFWKRQRPEWRVDSLPDWLELDLECGALTGTAPVDFREPLEARLTVFDAQAPQNQNSRTITLTPK